jgi:cyclic beta-1,2-glucan synthetase
MPLLVMPPRPFSLLDDTCHSAVHRQIAYGRARGVPWGISESAYNVRDRHDTYQYRAFGVPDLHSSEDSRAISWSHPTRRRSPPP